MLALQYFLLSDTVVASSIRQNASFSPSYVAHASEAIRRLVCVAQVAFSRIMVKGRLMEKEKEEEELHSCFLVNL